VFVPPQPIHKAAGVECRRVLVTSNIKKEQNKSRGFTQLVHMHAVSFLFRFILLTALGVHSAQAAARLVLFPPALPHTEKALSPFLPCCSCAYTFTVQAKPGQASPFSKTDRKTFRLLNPHDQHRPVQLALARDADGAEEDAGERAAGAVQHRGGRPGWPSSRPCLPRPARFLA